MSRGDGQHLLLPVGLAVAEGLRGTRGGLQVDLSGGDSLISRARSVIANRFLGETDHSHLLFVDSDIAFEPEAVFRLLDARKELIDGVCPLKTIDWEKARQAALDGVRDLQGASIGYVVRFIPNANSTVEVEDGFAEVAMWAPGS